jgi:signal transduction histidine kinase
MSSPPFSFLISVWARKVNKPKIAYLLAVSLVLPILSSIVFGSVPDSRDLSIEQSWLEASSGNLTPAEALMLFTEGEGRPLERTTFRLGSEEKRIWLLLTATNRSTKIMWRQLLTGLPHSRFLRAILIRPKQGNSQGEVLIDEHENRPFDQRNNSFRLLNSDSFEILPGEKVHVLVQAAIQGPSYLPLSLVSPEAFNALRLRDSVFAAQFYVFEATLGVIFLLFGLAVKHRVAILYALMFLLGLLAMADIDGHAFHWLWPNSPTWNSWSPLIVLPILNALGFVIIHQLLRTIDTKRLAWLKRLALGFSGISLMIPALLPWAPFPTLVQAENLLTILVFMLQPLAFATWLHLGSRNFASWLALLTVSLVIASMIVPVFVDVELPEMLSEHLHHAAYLIVGLMIMIVITAHLIGIRKDQEAAMARELAFAKRDAEMNQALFKAEQKYSQARHLAGIHQRQLASASHDLRQPITSLRSTIDAITKDQEPDIRRQLHDAFAYLEKLCNHYLKETHPDSVPKTPEETTVETYPVSLILNTVERMFAEEAANRRIELRSVRCDALLQVPPLALMRIVSNIVANAVRHHPGLGRARVLLGCRRISGRLNIVVCDNGAGMEKEELAALQQPYRKGKESAGEGLGLAIAHQLAGENGITIRIKSQHGKGSCFVLILPSPEAAHRRRS